MDDIQPAEAAAGARNWAVFDPPPPSVPPPPLPLLPPSNVAEPLPQQSADAAKCANNADALRIEPPKLFSDPVGVRSVLEPLKVETLKPLVETVRMESVRHSQPVGAAHPPMDPAGVKPVTATRIVPLNKAPAPPVAAVAPTVPSAPPLTPAPIADTSTPITDPLTQRMRKDAAAGATAPPLSELTPRTGANAPTVASSVPVIESLKLRNYQMARAASKEALASAELTPLVTSSEPPVSAVSAVRAKAPRSPVLVIDFDASEIDPGWNAAENRESLVPYSFRECWESKEVPENETKKQFYWRRFCEFVLMTVACCIRCVGPV